LTRKGSSLRRDLDLPDDWWIKFIARAAEGIAFGVLGNAAYDALTKASEEPQPEESEPTPTPAPAFLKAYFVVYTDYWALGPRLWGINGDGSGAHPLKDTEGGSNPVFVPGSDRLVFFHQAGPMLLYDLRSAQTLARMGMFSSDLYPTWSQDGQRMACSWDIDEPWICIANPRTMQVTDRLTPGRRPCWSSQGDFIAYDTCRSLGCGIFRINSDGSGKRRLSSDGGLGAVVSLDGKKIAYCSRASGDPNIYRINADGSGRRQLTRESGSYWLPAWSPDGKYIYYLGYQRSTGWAVMVMNADGSQPRRIIAISPGKSIPDLAYGRIAVTWNQQKIAS
jgi:hypothetical protein